MKNDKSQNSVWILARSVTYCVLSIGIVSVLSTIFGVLSGLYPVVSVLLFFALLLVGRSLFLFTKDVFTQNLGIFHSMMLVFLCFTLVSHLVGVFLPETGFDALWYHLPTIRINLASHQLVYNPIWYQSLYPQFANMYFSLGFLIGKEFAVKALSYSIFLVLMMMSYTLSRTRQTKTQALATTNVILLFHVVSWQSSSAYVDLFSTVFLLCAVQLTLLSKLFPKSNRVYFVSFCLGIFLGTKFINLGFMPVVLIILLSAISHHLAAGLKRRAVVGAFVLFLALCSFWYVRAFLYTGYPLYPVGSEYAGSVITQMGVGSWQEWLWLRFQQLPSLWYEFVFQADGYTTWLFALFLPFVLLAVIQMTQKRSDVWIGAIAGYGLFFWFFFPPPSIRYALASVILLWIFWTTHTWQIVEKKRAWNLFVQICFIINLLVMINVRVFINTRGFSYLLGKETENEYLNRFRNGFLDEKLDQYYFHNKEM